MNVRVNATGQNQTVFGIDLFRNRRRQQRQQTASVTRLY